MRLFSTLSYIYTKYFTLPYLLLFSACVSPPIYSDLLLIYLFAHCIYTTNCGVISTMRIFSLWLNCQKHLSHDNFLTYYPFSSYMSTLPTSFRPVCVLLSFPSTSSKNCMVRL